MPLRREPDPRTLQPGDAFGAYVVDGQLGEGGMGIVFRAIREDGAVVALKVLKPGLVADENATRRFAREARAAAAVDHPHLIDVIEAGDVDGTGFLAMRYVPGRSLDDRIREHGPLPVQDTTRVVAEIASALDALHAAGLVHRDVKPSNILLDDERGALLTDFGLAKSRDYSMLTAPGQMLGTLDYIAPEMLRGAEPGPSADLYALGCVVFECLSSASPAPRRSAGAACSRSGWPTSATSPRIRAPSATTLRPNSPRRCSRPWPKSQTHGRRPRPRTRTC
jgi:serine/threonine protein kinase